jgi:hypothetical protein
MQFVKHSLCVLAASVAIGGALPAMAGSSAASSAAQSANSAVGSLSDSVSGSSQNSQNAALAGGDYQLIQAAVAPQRPGFMQLTLRAARAKDGEGDVVLSIPQKAFDNSGLATGDKVAARARAYGVELANAHTRATFFLVMNDAAYRELASHPIAL